METSKAHILAQLQKDLLPLQGYKPVAGNRNFESGLGCINQAFPHATFPLGAIHEFVCSGKEDVSASCGFIAGVVAAIMQKGGVSIWISSSRMIFPPALKSFGIDPEKVIFVCLQKEREILWALEEALKCEGLAAVVTEISHISFTVSRRFQLAVEQSGVTGFVIRKHAKTNPTACVSRWKITALPTEAEDQLPGLGAPRWNVELLKIRNGTTGNWHLEWYAGKFRQVYKLPLMNLENQRKTG